MTTTLQQLARSALPAAEAQPPTQLARGRLLPMLHRVDQFSRPGLSDDGFSDSPASIALSRQLRAGLHCHGDSPESPGSGVSRATRHTSLVTVSQRGLGELDLSPQQAWDLAADNVLHHSREAEGIRFYTRPAAMLFAQPLPALQVGASGASPTSWLAHPHTFTVLHSHLRRLLGTEVRYLAPTREVLLAFPANAPELRTLSTRLEEHSMVPGEALLGGWEISYECGFPAVSGIAH
ncbi:hypothetical protein [Corynebacterium sp. A21]|uniref:hypothetical protein n=1 Tax=Corynebacterium sp. A21 TaxID=3457318 RepID=UPI003FD0115D